MDQIPNQYSFNFKFLYFVRLTQNVIWIENDLLPFQFVFVCQLSAFVRRLPAFGFLLIYLERIWTDIYPAFSALMFAISMTCCSKKVSSTPQSLILLPDLWSKGSVDVQEILVSSLRVQSTT